MITSNKARRGGRRGSALIMSVIVIASLSVLSLAFLQGSLQQDKEGLSRIDEARANMLLEAAFAEGLAALNGGFIGSVGTIDAPVGFGDGLFWVEATDLGDGHTRLYATAMVGGARMSQELVAKVEVKITNFTISGVVAQGDLTIWPNVAIDSYDPSLGSWESQPKSINSEGNEYVNNEGVIATNGTVDMKPGASIMGDVIVGPGQSITGVKGTVEGTTTQAEDPIKFGLPKLPNIASSGDLDANGASITSGIYRFDDIKVSNLNVQGPATIICNSLEIVNDAKLNINATNGGVNFMVIGDYKTGNQQNFKVNTDAPSDVRFFLYDDLSLEIKPNDRLFGLFYAPRTSFELESGVELFGAVVCNELVAAPKCKLHFDETLVNDPVSIIGTPTVTRAYWGEAALPDEVRQAAGRDPFKALGVDASSLLKAADAWDPTYRPLEDQYITTSSDAGDVDLSGGMDTIDTSQITDSTPPSKK